MSTLTKEWLLKTIAELEEERDSVPGAVNEDAARALEAMKIALASLEAEAVAYVDPFAFHNFSVYRAGETDNKRMGREWMWANPDAGLIPVYTAPPAPVSVPDEATPENIEILASTFAPRGVTYQWDRDECNAAADSWNACRAAMLQDYDGNSPVIPDGWVLVPVEPTMSQEFAGYRTLTDTGKMSRLMKTRLSNIYRAMIAAAPQQEVK